MLEEPDELDTGVLEEDRPKAPSDEDAADVDDCGVKIDRREDRVPYEVGVVAAGD